LARAGASPAGTGGANHALIAGTPVSSNVWHHAALTLDGTNLRIYLDGVLDGTLATTALPCAAAIGHAALGTALDSTGDPGGNATPGWFAGVLDEARVWNVARSLAQIQATKDVEINVRDLVLYELELAGCRASAGEMRRVMPHVADGRMRLHEVMTHEFPLTEFAAAMATFRDPTSGAIKIIVKP